jgi:putative FmdB family regulatory protein
MPTYEYICNTCGEKFDHFQSMTSSILKARPDCEKSDCSVKRIVSGGSGLIFKGSGFYLTDYKNKKPESKSKNDSKNDKKQRNKVNKTAKKTKVKDNN